MHSCPRVAGWFWQTSRLDVDAYTSWLFDSAEDDESGSRACDQRMLSVADNICSGTSSIIALWCYPSRSSLTVIELITLTRRLFPFKLFCPLVCNVGLLVVSTSSFLERNMRWLWVLARCSRLLYRVFRLSRTLPKE